MVISGSLAVNTKGVPPLLPASDLVDDAFWKYANQVLGPVHKTN